MATSTCQQCETTFDDPKRARRFCSRKCANTAHAAARSIEHAAARSIEHAAARPLSSCEVCGAEFYVHEKRRAQARFCSRKCRGVSMRGKPAAGAMVHGNSGVGLSGFRPDLGHFCRSRWEANYARYLLATGHTYQYEPSRFVIRLGDGSEHGYTPDFLVDGAHYAEVKGWMRPSRRQAEIIAAAQTQLPLPLALVAADAYREIARQHAATIPGWEHPGDPKPELPKRLCPTCGNAVTSIFLKTKYCSRACFNATGRKAKETRTCPTCSKTFGVSPHQTDKVYCSKPCWYAVLKTRPLPDGMLSGEIPEEIRERMSQAQLKRSTRHERVAECRRCGRALSRQQMRDAGRYCSHACYIEASAGNVRPPVSEETRERMRVAQQARRARLKAHS